LPTPTLKNTFILLLCLVALPIQSSFSATNLEAKLEKAKKRLEVLAANFTSVNYAGNDPGTIKAAGDKLDRQRQVVDSIIKEIEKSKRGTTAKLGKSMTSNKYYIGLNPVSKSFMKAEYNKGIREWERKKEKAKRDCKKEHKNSTDKDAKIAICIEQIQKEANAQIKDLKQRISDIDSGKFSTMTRNPKFDPKKNKLDEKTWNKEVESSKASVRTACVVPNSSECAAAQRREQSAIAARRRGGARYGAIPSDCNDSNATGATANYYTDDKGRTVSVMEKQPRCVGQDYHTFEFKKGGRQERLKKLECSAALANLIRKGLVDFECSVSGYGNKKCTPADFSRIDKEAKRKLLANPIKRPVYIYGVKPTFSCQGLI
jgi:hypothetical protein